MSLLNPDEERWVTNYVPFDITGGGPVDSSGTTIQANEADTIAKRVTDLAQASGNIIGNLAKFSEEQTKASKVAVRFLVDKYKIPIGLLQVQGMTMTKMALYQQLPGDYGLIALGLAIAGQDIPNEVLDAHLIKIFETSSRRTYYVSVARDGSAVRLERVDDPVAFDTSPYKPGTEQVTEGKKKSLLTPTVLVAFLGVLTVWGFNKL